MISLLKWCSGEHPSSRAGVCGLFFFFLPLVLSPEEADKWIFAV